MSSPTPSYRSLSSLLLHSSGRLLRIGSHSSDSRSAPSPSSYYSNMPISDYYSPSSSPPSILKKTNLMEAVMSTGCPAIVPKEPTKHVYFAEEQMINDPTTTTTTTTTDANEEEDNDDGEDDDDERIFVTPEEEALIYYSSVELLCMIDYCRLVVTGKVQDNCMRGLELMSNSSHAAHERAKNKYIVRAILVEQRRQKEESSLSGGGGGGGGPPSSSSSLVDEEVLGAVARELTAHRVHLATLRGIQDARSAREGVWERFRGVATTIRRKGSFTTSTTRTNNKNNRSEMDEARKEKRRAQRATRLAKATSESLRVSRFTEEEAL